MKKLTFGAEEEFILLDSLLKPVSINFNEFSSKIEDSYKKYFSPELHKCMVEIKTDVCKSDFEVISQLEKRRSILTEIMKEKNISVLPMGIHPNYFAVESEIESKYPYCDIIEEYQMVGMLNSVAGIHIHVGAEYDSLAFTFNYLRNLTPFLNAICGSSSFYMGRDTGLKSFRYRMFKIFPRSGIPEPIESLDEYFEKIDFLMKTGSMKKRTSLWSDLRIHPIYKTIEVRSMDMHPNIKVTKGIISLIYGVSNYILNNNFSFDILPTYILEENSWRACRYGINTDFIENINGDLINGVVHITNIYKKIEPDLDEYTKTNILDLIEILKLDIRISNDIGSYIIK